MRLALACTLLAPLVSGHAILLDVSSGGSVAYPRTGISGTQGTGAGISGSGTKLQPFADAKIYADETKCGGAVKNKDPGVETPLVAFSPNDVLTVKWRMTIPHPIDYPLDAPDNTASPGSGVRIAMHYGATDSFKDNILAGGVAGDPRVGTLAAGTSEDDPGRNGEVTATVTLGAKTCDYCTLQWIWAANNDGGSYLMCVDLSITAYGQLPDFNAIPSEVGKLVAGAAPSLHCSMHVPCMCSGMGGECRDRRGEASRFKPATPIHTLGVLAPPLPPGVVARPPPPPGNVGGVPANGSGNQQAASQCSCSEDAVQAAQEAVQAKQEAIQAKQEAIQAKQAAATLMEEYERRKLSAAALESASSGLDLGQTIGVAVGCSFAVVLLVALGLFVLKRGRRKGPSATNEAASGVQLKGGQAI